MGEAAWRRRFRAPRIGLPLWARDRPDRLLYGSNASGKWELYAWNRERDTHRKVTDRPEGTMWGRLDPSGEWIWWFDDTKGNEFGRWMREPFEGGPAEPAAPDLRPGYGGGLALGAGFALIGLSDDEGSHVHLVRDGGSELLYEHREEAAVAGLSRDESMWALSHSEHGDSRNPDVRVLDLDGKTIGELSDGPGRGLWPSWWSRVPGDGRLLVQHERTGIQRPLVWLPSTNDVLEPAIGLPGEIGASWYPDARALLLRHGHRGRTELYRLPLEDDGGPQRLDVPGGTIEGAAVRPDGDVWFGRSSGSTPPEIRSSSAGVLLRPPGEPAPSGVGYTDLDVGGIHVFLAEPDGQRPHPAIFQVHGGPPSHDRDAFSPRVQAWVDHGFAVVLVNYRGSTGYGKAWRDVLEHDPGFPEVADVTKVRDRLVADRVIDPEKTILHGGSWGGYVTLLGLGTRPESWAQGIAAVPVADYVAAFEDEMEPLKAFDRALFGGSPEEIPDLYEERSPITYVEKVQVPVMILAGENDPRCPIRQIDNYVARLQELGAPHEVYRFDAGHASLVTDETVRQTEAMLAFAARNLGTPPPA